MKAKSGFKVAGRLLLLLCCLYFFICSLSFLSDSFRMVGGRSLGGKYHQVADLSETVNINPGEQCKSLKSTSRLLDVGLDVGSDGHLGISFLTSLNQQCKSACGILSKADFCNMPFSAFFKNSDLLNNPIVGVMIGVLVTVLVQVSCVFI